MQYYKPFTRLFALINNPLRFTTVLSKWYKWGNWGTGHTAKWQSWNLMPCLSLHQGYLNLGTTGISGTDDSWLWRAALCIVTCSAYPWSLPTRCQQPPSQLWHQKWLQTLTNVPGGKKTSSLTLAPMTTTTLKKIKSFSVKILFVHFHIWKS